MTHDHSIPGASTTEESGCSGQSSVTAAPLATLVDKSFVAVTVSSEFELEGKVYRVCRIDMTGSKQVMLLAYTHQRMKHP